MPMWTKAKERAGRPRSQGVRRLVCWRGYTGWLLSLHQGPGVGHQLLFNKADLVKLFAEYDFARGTQPLLQECPIDRAEIGGELEVAVVEIRQAGRLSCHASVVGVPDNEHGRCGAVVCAAGSVLRHAPTKFTEGQGQH